MSRIRLLLAVGLLTPLMAAPLSAQAVSPVNFARGTSSTTINGSIQGYRYIDYRVSVRAGQMLKVNMRTLRGSPYFNVMEPGSKDVAIFTGDVGGSDFEVRTLKNGAYTIRVYQMRASARRNEIAGYRLTIGASGAPASDHPYVPTHKTGDAMLPGTPYHATAPVRCKVDFTGRWGECKAGIIRRSNTSATVHLDTIDGGERTILFRDGRAVSSDSETPIRVERWDDTSIISIGQYEVYEIPDALPFGG